MSSAQNNHSIIKSDVCGKAILLGEHFVVYGSPAIAVSIPHAVEVRVEASETLALRIPQWDLHLHPRADGHLIAQAWHALMLKLRPISPALFTASLHLPAGVGLGSSASLGVAVLDAILQKEGWSMSETERYHALFAWERIFHGQPSGFDHAAVMRVGLTQFERFSDVPIQSIRTPRDLRFVIAQVQEGASTKTMVDSVRRWRDAHPQPFDAMLERAHTRANTFVHALHDPNLTDMDWWPRAGALLSDNQRDLQHIGVSTAALDAACHTAEQAGAWGAKLVGAGGGGCLLALVDASCEQTVMDALRPYASVLLPVHLPAQQDP